MRNFNTNQARHLYVASNGVANSVANLTDGKIFIGSDADGDVYIMHKNLDGELVRSDTIPHGCVDYVTSKSAADLVKIGQAFNVAVASGLTADDLLGLNVMVTVKVHELIGIDYGESISVTGSCHVTAGMSLADIVSGVAESLAANAGVNEPYFSVAILGDDTTTFYVIAEPTKWIRGKNSATFKPLEVTVSTFADGSDQIAWATVTDASATRGNSINGDFDLADLEYFSMGERGDTFRGSLWPNDYQPTYAINPSTANDEGLYGCITVQYYWQGKAENIVKSPRTIQIAVPTASVTTVTSALREALGLAES